MDSITVREFAINADVSLEAVIDMSKEIDIKISDKDDLLSLQQQLMLMQHLRLSQSDVSHKKEFTINNIINSRHLNELNLLLTQAMASRKIQSLIKDENLTVVINATLKLITKDDDQLYASAILGRLAAVARGRELNIYNRADEVISIEPASIESLEDGEAKQYAAQVLSYVTHEWVGEYSYREALLIDTADNARRELLFACLARVGNVADWLGSISSHATVLALLNNTDAKLKRLRRLFLVMSEVAGRWRGDVGSDFGSQLSKCLSTFVPRKLGDVDEELVFSTLDHLLSILLRVIELRFSMALHASTFALMDDGKRLLGAGLWGRFIDKSSVMPSIRMALLETALVLARQNRSDKQVVSILLAAYTSRPQAAVAIKKHFVNARDLDPDIADWWRSVGEASESQRNVEHKVGNTEDSQIGALLIEVEGNREAMNKVGRAVVPLLEISDPVLASTVKKAVDGYHDIAQTARRLARMRKLSKTDLKGERLEYNPLEHEMLGGHRAGVRRVKVVRDGIMKEFAGKIKTLVKPWVEPEEN